MSRALHRVSGGKSFGGGQDSPTNSWDSQMKDKTEKEDMDKSRSLDPTYISLKIPSRLLSDNASSRSIVSENGVAYDPPRTGTLRTRPNIPLFILVFCTVMFSVGVLTSFSRLASIRKGSGVHVFYGHKVAQENVYSDLLHIGELVLNSAKWKEHQFCPQEFEDHVPCFNVSENNQDDGHCGQNSRQNCLVLPPKDYKVPLRWPTGRDVIWRANVKVSAQEVLSARSLTRRMMLEDDQISFRSSSRTYDGVEDYAHQIAEMIGLRNESSLIEAGVRTILDIGCGFGSLGAHLSSRDLLTMCIANYEAGTSQVQLTLERGLPAMIGSFTSKQLPYPSLSFDMLHCELCGIDWDQKDGLLLIEADRVLKPGGYFVWTDPLANTETPRRSKEDQKRWNIVRSFAENLCWDVLAQQEDTVVWKKTSKKSCYSSRKPGPSLCSKNVESPYNRPLQNCIGGTQSHRWIPIEARTRWPSRAKLNSIELKLYVPKPEDFAEDAMKWNFDVQNYWSLLAPLIFSDHPKRPGDEEPSPPFNMVRNVLDMNAHYGGFNAALLEAGKTVWVMNVVSTSDTNNYLPLIHDRGFIGVLHDWCEPFPTYPRTYDMVHADGVLSLEIDRKSKCTTLDDIFVEIDRILRPEGWVIIRDKDYLIETARALAGRVRWDSRVVDIESNSDEKLLICQKPLFKTKS